MAPVDDVPSVVPATMAAVHLTGHGGYDTLEYRTDAPVPAPGRGQVLIQVAAAGINNTDINTRTAWYSKSVNQPTSDAADGVDNIDEIDGSWTGEPLAFPLIQGADCCGYVVAVGDDVDPGRVGQRVLVRPMQPRRGAASGPSCVTFGSEMNGGFAQFAVAPSIETLAVDCDWTDAELASIPCAYSTAEGMLHRGSVGAERVLVTGASGGVGSAAVQLAKRRGAEVIAVAGAAKAEQVRLLGADRVVERGESLVRELGANSVDVVVDLVGGPQWPEFIDVLRTGGKYICSGAIAGPIVDLDLRILYLKDLTFFGSTFQQDVVFENVIRYIEADEIRPVVAAEYPLSEIVAAQEAFLAKQYTGKLVLIPPGM